MKNQKNDSIMREHLILYLDFDGVLHPDEVYLVNGQPELRWPEDPSLSLFCWMPFLENTLAGFPDVRIILSTSWVRMLDFNRSRSYLSLDLQERVIGATWHSRMRTGGTWDFPRDPFDHLTRFQQIDRHVRRHGVERWIAIDDDTTGWPDERRSNLIETDSELGINAPDIQCKIVEVLCSICR